MGGIEMRRVRERFEGIVGCLVLSDCTENTCELARQMRFRATFAHIHSIGAFSNLLHLRNPLI